MATPSRLKLTKKLVGTMSNRFAPPSGGPNISGPDMSLPRPELRAREVESPDATVPSVAAPMAAPFGTEGPAEAKMKNAVEKAVNPQAKRASGGSSKSVVGWAEKQLDTQEGSKKQQQWASDLGMSASLPWCGMFVAAALKAKGVKSIPSNPAYSGDWLTVGKKVSKPKPGDVVVFDWGDGGMTDHVAIYAGNGQVIGGNQSNAVTKVPLQKGAVVGYRRVSGGGKKKRRR